MADDVLTAPPSVTDDAAAGDRGRLEIKSRVTERIAEVAASRVAGVVRQDGSFGRGLPRAEGRQAGQRVRLQVRIAVLWGRSLTRVAADTRAEVARQVAGLTGLAVDSVDVDITTVLPQRELAVTPPRRVL